MTLINLNDSNFESKIFRPFNDGKAGIAEVTIESIFKNSEKNCWVITFLDKNGAKLLDFQNYLDINHPDVGKRLKAQGVVLKHYWSVIVGDVKIPVFNSPVEMLDTVMKNIQQVFEKKTFRLMVDYGYGEYHSKYLLRKRFVPFIEDSSNESTELYLSGNAHKQPSDQEDITSSSQSEIVGNILR